MAFPRKLYCFMFSILIILSVNCIDEVLAGRSSSGGLRKNILQEQTYIKNNSAIKLDGEPRDKDVSFYEHYEALWGFSHISPLYKDREVLLSMDPSSGAGFQSKSGYGSGFFHMRIRTPNKDTAGVITAFYLTSLDNNKHDELDFEFLGNRQGKPVTLQTNVFTNGVGNKEERMTLWFDPSADFHDYRILWNPRQIVFYIDETPIRIFKNHITVKHYPTKPMRVMASLWNGESWATDGGKEKINWNYSPFVAGFQGFDVHACAADNERSAERCRSDSPQHYWNEYKYWSLDNEQRRAYDDVRKRYLNYGYCTDTYRYPVPPPECNR